MARRKSKKDWKQFTVELREIRIMLHEINQKVEHLIKTYRKYYFTTDFSNSSNQEFKS